ncbi:serine/threonine protein kinase [Synechococcus sp. PCC 7502]|uniref:serine/threonine protein kinase n=1 Tax=Synechococcus sp. PCC 7502 TaxID=1173263 RepID=UPI00029FC91C|nr:serine/threonine-protein kinase [Synechococcus sp. PCC 7502]AFY73969.1 serine/threonine protein kinase [Synechococcus sp. PCC 7502]
MTNSQHSNSWIGQSIGDRQRYRITNRLGGGGMGDVFLAVDTLLGQQVALKLLKEKLLSEGDIRQRFEREVLLCAAIQSENVVQVKDYGVSSDGYPFFVMEYLQGQTLGQLLQKEKRLSIERTVGIISQVCDGLHSAHTGVIMSHDGATLGERVQFVHRDLKPENIFLVRTSLGELVKVLDFGIAKVFSRDQQSTNTGLFMGTFQYAAPEQIEVRKDLDLRADIYSIGMILYEMLSGTDPFGCSLEGRAAGGTCWLRSHISEPPRSLRSQPNCDHIPVNLEAVVMQCLRKSPNGRFSSVMALSQALQAAAKVKLDATTMLKSMRTSDSDLAKTTPMQAIQPRPTSVIKSQDSQEANVSLTQIQSKLEQILLNYVGPIASILIKQASLKATNPSDLIELISQQIPPAQQSEFKTAIKAAIAKINTEDDKEINKEAIPQTKPSIKTISVLNLNANHEISQDFINYCEQELAEIIGPMAQIILKKALANRPSQNQLVDMLAQHIPNPASAAKFRQSLIS